MTDVKAIGRYDARVEGSPVGLRIGTVIAIVQDVGISPVAHVRL